MSPLGENRHLQFEQLELRAMLAGNVLVSVVDGDLQVAGDDKDNVLEFQQLSPSNPRALHGGVSFQISPDADTSINGNDPGVGIVVAGVTRDIDVDMGEGGDELVVLGANGHQVRDREEAVIDVSDTAVRAPELVRTALRAFRRRIERSSGLEHLAICLDTILWVREDFAGGPDTETELVILNKRHPPAIR